MNIALGTIFYNNKKDLLRLCNSIPKGSINTFIGVDGIFNYNFGKDGNKTGLSNDGSREILYDLEDKGIKVHIASCANEIEVKKRNRYLELCEQNDIDLLIIVDSDEYFYYYDKDPLTQWDKFRQEMEYFTNLNKDKNVYSIKTILADDYALMEYHRIWYKPGEMRYFRGSHYHYLNMKNGEYEMANQHKMMHTQQSNGTIQSLFLRHNHGLRTKEQMEQRSNYQYYLINYEHLIQSHTPHETADQISRKYPYKYGKGELDVVGSCPCESCTPYQKKEYDIKKKK